MSIVDSTSEPYIDGLLVLSDDPPYVPAIELSYINTMLSLLSDHQLPTNSCNNHLPEALDIPLIPCLDQSSPDKPSTNNHSRNRCASVDLAAELSQRDHSWHRINDEISANQLQQEERAQLNMINGDILHDHVLIDADYAPNTAAISANYAFSDLEDVSDFLFMESETASTQSVSHLGNSISLSGVDWKSDLTDDSINQVESDGGDPSCGFHNMEVEKKNGGEVRASWQQKQVGEIRASWQQKQGDEIRASWQQKQVGEIRASWQPPPPSEGREGAPSSQLQDVGPRGPISAVWAGPTLMDIESALAKSGSHTHNNTSIAISSDPSAASSTVLVEYTLLQEEITALVDVRKLLIDDLPTCKNELVEQDILSASWRSKLQKRNHVELKHSIKVRREENAVGDGYRWRKYGQKSIKNSPFPRSYYKCSSGKCNAKKQVEGCHEDATLLLVTYVGIHLHHRPKPLRKIAC